VLLTQISCALTLSDKKVKYKVVLILNQALRHEDVWGGGPVLRGGIHNFRDWCWHLYSICSSGMQLHIIVQAYLENQCTVFHAAGWTCKCFASFYLESCIWPDAISRWMWQRMCIKVCANLGRSATETPAMIRQAFGEESMSVHGCLNGMSKLTDTRFSSKSGASPYFFYIKGIVHNHKEFDLTGQKVSSTYWCDVLRRLRENVWRLHPNFGDKMTTHRLTLPFSPGIFLPNNMTIVPHHPTFLCFPNWR
jgi:hypothetical protein